MKFGHFLKALAPVLAVALAAGVSGCDGAKISINGEEGKKLSEIDLNGPVPSELALFSPDEVQITQGDKLAIKVDGDPEAVEQIRFSLKDGTLGVLRADKNFSGSGKLAVIHVTMPAPKEVVMAGSGKISTAALANDAKVTVLGSGRIDSQAVSGGKLEVTMPGSGSFRAAGNVDNLELTIMGSGSAELHAVRTGTAKITIMGSGGAAFTSDGDVEATIMGSGSVKVKGRASCKVTAMGSGTLVCENGVTRNEGKEPPAPPQAPEPPEPPEPPKVP